MKDRVREIVSGYIEMTGNADWLLEMSIDDYLKIRKQAIFEVKEMPSKTRRMYEKNPTQKSKEEPKQVQPTASEKNTVVSFGTKKVQYKEEEEELDEIAILASLGDD